jgi:hypothetical protein
MFNFQDLTVYEKFNIGRHAKSLEVPMQDKKRVLTPQYC